MATDDTRCPNCGSSVPVETGQHAGSLVSDTVSCPHCGASTSLRDAGDKQVGDVERAAAAPPGRSEDAESFSGQESAAGVAEELKNKPT